VTTFTLGSIRTDFDVDVADNEARELQQGECKVQVTYELNDEACFVVEGIFDTSQLTDLGSSKCLNTYTTNKDGTIIYSIVSCSNKK
jgi:hypothetical protein